MSEVQDLELLRSEDELTATESSSADARALSMLVNLHTSLPGIIVSFDSTKQTATVQPAIKRVFVDGKREPLPVCQDVPVCMFANALTAPIDVGDNCILVFSERCIDRWYQADGVQDPHVFRMHDLSDGFAIVGFNSQPKVLSSLRTDGPELRTKSGSMRVSIAGGMVFLGTSQSSAATSAVELPIFSNGVVLAEAVDTLTELPRFLLGGTSLKVVALK